MRAGAQPTFIDLFAGCGGIARGFVDQGFELVGAVEHDLAAAATFAANFGEELTTWGGVEQYHDVPEVDVVVGGPPCQGFSNLGKRDADDERNRLWREYVRIVRTSGCRVFVMENVDRFNRSDEVASLVAEARPGGQLDGFAVTPYVVDAADYGVPQRRRRTLVVGSRIGPVATPSPTNDKLGDVTGLPWNTVSDALDGLSTVYDDLPDTMSTYFGEQVCGAFKLHEIHIDRTYTELSKARFRAIPAGGNRFDLPEELQAPCWRGYRRGATDVMGRLHLDRPANTIRTEFFKPEKGRYLHPYLHRALTHAEAARIQGFDDRHVWCGKRLEIARQIGNAVPPGLAAAVAEVVRRRLAS